MLKTVYSNAFKALAKKPFKLWGISILATALEIVVALAFGMVAGLAFLLIVLLSTGMTMVYLHGYRGENVEGKHIFAAFKDGKTAGRTLKGVGWAGVMAILWGLIPIVGPVFFVIRTYQYVLAPYIALTEEGGDPFDIYKVSRERMKGYCLQMFLANIIPGLVVGAVIGILTLLGMLFSLIPYVGIVFGVLFGLITSAVSTVAMITLPLFKGLVNAAFYEEIMKARGLADKTTYEAIPENASVSAE